MEADTEYWLNIVIPIFMSIALVTTLVVLWRYDIEVSVQRIEHFLDLFRKKQNIDNQHLLKTAVSQEDCSLLRTGKSNTADSGTSEIPVASAEQAKVDHKTYGAIPKRPGPLSTS